MMHMSTFSENACVCGGGNFRKRHTGTFCEFLEAHILLRGGETGHALFANDTHENLLENVCVDGTTGASALWKKCGWWNMDFTNRK